MKIAISHLGNVSHLIPATSVIRGIRKRPIKTNIVWIVPNEHSYIFKHNKDVNAVFSPKTFSKKKREYDLFINLWPISAGIEVSAKEHMGFGFYEEFNKFKGALFNTDYFLNMSIFQLYYLLCGLTWGGEGYDINYYPKTRTNKKRVGISVANANLRNYVLENLELENMKVWYVPYKKNIFKKMDEINRCKKIVTDDLATFHLAMAMRKYVYYLNTSPLTMKLEMFGNGQIHKVPASVFQ